MDQLTELLARTDAQLEQIAVSGQDAYRMVNARTLLKAVFDALQSKKVENEEVTDDG